MDKFFTETDELGNKLVFKRDGDKVWSVPSDESNSDYQRYLRWLENPNADDTQGGIN